MCTGCSSSFTEKETENVRHYDLKVQQIVEKAGVMNLLQISTSCVKIFSLEDYQEKLEDFAHTRRVKHTSTVIEPFLQFHTLVKLDDVEDITNDEKTRTLHLPLENKNIIAKLASQKLSSESYGSNPENMLTQANDPNNKSKPPFRKYCNYCHISNHCFQLFSKTTRRRRKTGSIIDRHHQ